MVTNPKRVARTGLADGDGLKETGGDRGDGRRWRRWMIRLPRSDENHWVVDENRLNQVHLNGPIDSSAGYSSALIASGGFGGSDLDGKVCPYWQI